MKQSKIDSSIEAVVNTIIGSLVAFIGQLFWFPLAMGVDLTLPQQMITTAFFTVLSLVRLYGFRRLFNNRSVYQYFKDKFT